MIKIKSLGLFFAIISGLLFSCEYQAQLSEYLKTIKQEELELLKEGVLLVELNEEESTEMNSRIMYFVDSLYSFSDHYFFYNSQLVENEVPRFFDSAGKERDEIFELDNVFILSFHFKEFELMEEWRFLRKKDEEILRPEKKKGKKNTAYLNELNLFSPNSTVDGGAIVRKAIPMLKTIEAKRRIIADYYVFARFHSELSRELNYKKSIIRIQELLEKRERELNQFR